MSHRTGIKTPPILRPGASQEARRQKALEEQRKSRALRIDAARNIDLFASLSLTEKKVEDDDSDTSDDNNVLPASSFGVARFLTQMDAPSSSVPMSIQGPAISTPSSSTSKPIKSKPSPTSKKSKSKSKKSKQRKATKWADKCMYAELLEMRDMGDAWASGEDDGLPKDLEREWVALAPVPKGKRCIAVSFAPSVSGPDEASNVLQANTALHSRVKGLAFMRFPAPLPPDTVLDCILDEEVNQTGVLHVLDVIRWRGTDVADCEADFRFWFRDARLAELIPQPEPSRTSTGLRPYPHRFLGVPYYPPPLTPALFLRTIIPAAQAHASPIPASNEVEMDTGDDDTKKATEEGGSIIHKSDGILLYVKEASYTSGETPLSCWVPAAPLVDAMDQEAPIRIFQRLIARRHPDVTDMMQ